MSFGINLKRNIALTTSDEIQQITKPLKKIFNITYFNYVKLYKNGARILLTDRADWIEYFYQNALYETNAVIKLEHLERSAFHLWHEFKNQPSFIIGKEKFNIDNGITIVEPNEEYTELYYFGTLADNHFITSLYLRNFDIFQRFILYFKDKAHALLQKAEHEKIYLPEKKIITSAVVDPDEELKNKIECFFDETPIEKFFIDESHGHYLTKREAMSLYLVLKGNTAKQIGRMLNISPRTAEDYINSVKNKLNVSVKKELIIKSMALGLHKKLAHGLENELKSSEKN